MCISHVAQRVAFMHGDMLGKWVMDCGNRYGKHVRLTCECT